MTLAGFFAYGGEQSAIFHSAAARSTRSVCVIGKDFHALAWQGLSYQKRHYQKSHVFHTLSIMSLSCYLKDFTEGFSLVLLFPSPPSVLALSRVSSKPGLFAWEFPPFPFGAVFLDGLSRILLPNTDIQLNTLSVFEYSTNRSAQLWSFCTKNIS